MQKLAFSAVKYFRHDRLAISLRFNNMCLHITINFSTIENCMLNFSVPCMFLSIVFWFGLCSLLSIWIVIRVLSFPRF